MLPELIIFIKIAVVVAIFMGVSIWLGTVFQNLKFQKHRMFKNEAAHRKTRLHDEALAKEKYKTDLLGKILSAKGDK